MKTRLAADIGPVAALAVYRACLSHSLRRFAGLAERSVVVFTPAAATAEFAGLAPKWERIPQSGGNLGRRLAVFVADAFRAGAGRVVCLGIDSPSLPVERIRRAFAALTRADVVVGPADDGGYYLIGLSRPTAEPFRNIDWGTAQVFRQTLSRCRAGGLSVARLPAWFDVDTAADLRRLLRRLPAGSPLRRAASAAGSVRFGRRRGPGDSR